MGRRLIRRSFRSRFGEHRGQVAVFEHIALFREGQQDRFACDSNPSSRVTRSGWHRRDVKDGVQVTGALGNRRDTAHGGFSGGNDDMRDPATTMADQAAAGCVGFAPDPTEWSIGRRVMRGEAGHQEPGVARHRRAERMNGTGSIVIQILLADQTENRFCPAPADITRGPEAVARSLRFAARRCRRGRAPRRAAQSNPPHAVVDLFDGPERGSLPPSSPNTPSAPTGRCSGLDIHAKSIHR